jgi:hypothetical protein
MIPLLIMNPIVGVHGGVLQKDPQYLLFPNSSLDAAHFLFQFMEEAAAVDVAEAVVVEAVVVEAVVDVAEAADVAEAVVDVEYNLKIAV